MKAPRRRGARSAPWKSPWRLCWFALALTLSAWFLLHMPPDRLGAPAGSRPALAAPAGEARPAAAGEKRRHRTELRKTTDTAKTMHGKRPSRARTLVRIFLMVGVAAFAAGIIESRRWYMELARLTGVLTRLARLPAAVGMAAPLALCSNMAADTVLAGLSGGVKRATLIVGGMVNSYIAYVSHSSRIMYVVVGAVGLPGLCYFGIQFGGGLAVILAVLLWHRWHGARREKTAGTAALPENVGENTEKPVPPWPETMKKSALSAASLLFRMAGLAVPLMLGMEWLLKTGALDFWERCAPDWLARLFPADLLSVVMAQLGGMAQGAAVAASLRAEGLVTDAQILLAMLAGSALGNPVRMLRRNLPATLAIFPASVALTIVFFMQFTRLAVTILAIALLAFCMHSMT